MKIFLTEPQDAMQSWLCERIKYVPTPNLVCFGNYDEEKGKLVAVVGYDNWSTASVEMHVASEGSNWMTKTLLANCFKYPFIHGGMKVLLGRVDEANSRAVRFNTAVGFKEVARIPNAWEGNRAMIIMAMQRNECRWISQDEQLSEVA